MSEENSTENPLILIDGSSYLYRAYHALPPLMSSKNQPTGAIRGVISMINKILLDHPNSPLAVIFDAKGKTFRHEMYKDYNANRPPMPEDLVKQIEPINQIVEALGIKLLSIKGVEADDVIGTLAEWSQSNDLVQDGLFESPRPFLIVSGDHDFQQLQKWDNVVQFSPMKKRFIKIKEPAEHILREHIIRGDRSDGVPNIYSPDDTFTENKRQKPIRKTIVAELLEHLEDEQGTVWDNPAVLYTIARCPKDIWIRNWQRNETLIDLNKIPKDIQDEILREFKNVKVGSRSGLFDYFIHNRLNNLIENIGDF